MSKPASNRLLYFFVAVGTLFPAALAAAAWSFLQSEEGSFAWSMAKLATQRMGAPGLAELRGIGCDTATVFTMGEIFALPSSPLSEEDREKLARSPERNRPLVQCGDVFGRTPTCEEVAKTYAPFAPDQDRAIVRVNSRGKIVCDGLYAASGEFIAPPSRAMLIDELEPDGEEVGDESP